MLYKYKLRGFTENIYANDNKCKQNHVSTFSFFNNDIRVKHILIQCELFPRYNVNSQKVNFKGL